MLLSIITFFLDFQLYIFINIKKSLRVPRLKSRGLFGTFGCSRHNRTINGAVFVKRLDIIILTLYYFTFNIIKSYSYNYSFIRLAPTFIYLILNFSYLNNYFSSKELFPLPFPGSQARPDFQISALAS